MNISEVDNAVLGDLRTEGVSCDVCGSNNTVFRFGVALRDGPYSGSKEAMIRKCFECIGCGHMSVDLYEPERHNNYYRALEKAYYDQHDKDTRRYSRTIELLAHRRLSRILDIGCGTGAFLSMFPTTIERYGIELSSLAAQRAVEKGIKIVTFEELAKPPLRNTFDVVTALDVVEHTKDLCGLRRAFADSLRPGGTLILLTADCQSGSAQRLGRYWYYTHYAEHISFFSQKSVRTWLDEDFERIEVLPTSHHPLRFVEVISILRAWTLFPAKLISRKLSTRAGNRNVTLWTAGDHMLVRAIRRTDHAA
jgi:SAM-dependent methyltransferase